MSQHPYDPKVVARFAKVLGVGEHVHEVRVIYTSSESKRVYVGYFDDAAALAKQVERHDGKAHIYVTVNAVKPELISRARNILVRARKRERSRPMQELQNVPVSTTDEDIAEQKRLYLDFDSRRPSEFHRLLLDQGGAG